MGECSRYETYKRQETPNEGTHFSMFIISGGNRCDCRHVDNHCQGTPQNKKKGKAKPARTEKQCRTQIPDPVSRLITVSDSLGLTELIESTGSIIKGAAFFVERRFIEPIFLAIN